MGCCWYSQRLFRSCWLSPASNDFIVFEEAKWHFWENAEKLIQEGKSKKEAYGNKNRHYFFVPEEARWYVLSNTAENIGGKIDHVCRIIERENPDLDGVLTNTKYNDKRKFPDDKLRKLISHFNSPRLQNSDLESDDIFGNAFEYLLEEFADETKKSGGNFFTPKGSTHYFRQ